MSDVAAGWYPDPTNGLAERWWTGQAWGEDVRPLAAPAPSMPPAPLLAVQAMAPARGQSCPVCGAAGSLHSRQKELTEKRRVKFGVFWVLFSLLTGGLGFLLWLVMPRSKQVISVDRYMECGACRARV